MQKAVIASLDDAFLETKTADSDRFVYSNYVVPLRITFDDDVTPILPDYRRRTLKVLVRAGILDGPGILSVLPALEAGEVVSRNRLEFEAGVEEPVEPTSVDASVAMTHLDDANELLEMIGGYVTGGDEVVARAARARIGEARSALAYSASFALSVTPATGPKPTQEEMTEAFLGLLQSDIAYFFLDRTRIRPKGFRVGEHVYGLSLTPGEEVTLEQKTFTKRQATFEEQSEQQAEFDLELASTLSTELQEGFSRQKNITDTWGLNVSKVGSYSSPVISDVAYGSFNTNHSVAYSKNIATADQETRNRSTKDSQTASAKVASKYRTAHKTTFRVASEQVFESTAKRVIRNPNAFTPITLHYFKILQRVEMTQERYGVRLGWMPSIKDPAFGFFEQIREGKDKIRNDVELSLPRKPDDPRRDASAAGAAPTPQTKWWASELTHAGNGAADGSMSGDFEIDVAYEDGWEWDGIVDNIDVRTFSSRSPDKYHADVKGVPVVVKGVAAGSALRVVVHIGAQADPFRRAMIDVQVNVRFVAVPVQTPLPTNEKEVEEAAAYGIALRDWEAKCDEMRALGRAAANEWEATMLTNLNPVSEMVDQLIKQLFPQNLRDEGWEIDLWQKLFDWERASYVAYPGWWADGPLRDPSQSPSAFINASWARLFLPVRVGMERLALRWIHGRTTRKMDAVVESRFDAIEADLKQYRQQTFGDQLEMMPPAADGAYQEKYDTLGAWTDLMPTDGTHVEVVQAYSMAADEVTLKASEDAAELRKAVIASHQQDKSLKEKAFEQITQPAALEVTISPYGTPDGST